jgi:hypothetical protein
MVLIGIDTIAKAKITAP